MVTRLQDAELPDLDRFLDPEAALQFCRDVSVWEEEAPESLTQTNFRYVPNKRAVISYRAEFGERYWLGLSEFSIELEAGAEQPRVFLFPSDPYLTGLEKAGDPTGVMDLIREHVGLRPLRVNVQSLRYLPTQRAILMHRLHWPVGQVRTLDLVARVLPPGQTQRWLDARELMSHSGFTIPRALGHWESGGCLWMDMVPGETLGTAIANGTAPAPETILNLVYSLWRAPVNLEGLQQRYVRNGVGHTLRTLRQVTPDGSIATPFMAEIDAIREFAEAWKPTSLAHNDFYEAQILLPPGGIPAIVDFEEAGAGDPLLDIGTFLAHLHWAGSTGRPESMARFRDYRASLKAAALHYFGWQASELALREAYMLLRLSANPVRRISVHTPRQVTRWLELMKKTLDLES